MSHADFFQQRVCCIAVAHTGDIIRSGELRNGQEDDGVIHHETEQEQEEEDDDNDHLQEWLCPSDARLSVFDFFWWLLYKGIP